MKLSSSELKIKKRAKTFYFASLFFSKNKQKDISILYTFCRYIDDLGDNPSIKKTEAKLQLELIKNDLIKKNSCNPIIQDFIVLIRKYNIRVSTPLHLISGVLSDLKDVRIKNYEELIIYSFRVAGSVGLMMCKLMEIKSLELNKKGILLGIAMQLTNIIRDVDEDLQNDRIYFPIDFLSFKFLNLNEIKQKEGLKRNFAKDLMTLIDFSNKVYATSWFGINKLPLKYRIPIAISSNLYQQIGLKIMKDSFSIWKKRIYLTTPNKVFFSLRTIFHIILNKKKRVYPEFEKKKFSVLNKFDSSFYE